MLLKEIIKQLTDKDKKRENDMTDIRQGLERCTKDVERYRAENEVLRQELQRYRADNEGLRMESQIWRETMQNTNRILRWHINRKYDKYLAEAQRRQRDARRQELHV